jgi:hypothetical protein
MLVLVLVVFDIGGHRAMVLSELISPQNHQQIYIIFGVLKMTFF